MFDVTELYASWTEDPTSFWQPGETAPQQLQETLTVNPESILDEDVWGEICMGSCPPADEAEYDELADEWLGTLVNVLREWSGLASRREGGAEALEKLLFLVRLQLARLDVQFSRMDSNTRHASTGRTGERLGALLGAVSRTIQGGIAQVFPATSPRSRGAIAMLYLEPMFQLLQYDVVLKDAAVVREITRVVCLGVKLQQQDLLARRRILQLVVYYPTSVRAVLEILETLQSHFDHSLLAEGVLRDIAEEASRMTDTQDSSTTSSAKAINAFLAGMGDVAPSLVVANLESIAVLIGSPVPQLRQAVIELAVPVVKAILSGAASEPSGSLEAFSRRGAGANGAETSDEPGRAASGGASGASGASAKAAFDLIKLVELRVNDQSFSCRLRAVQALAAVAEEPAFISRRNVFAGTAVAKMKDRTQLVRRQAMRLMKELVDTHPPLMHANNLSRAVWASSLRQIDEQLNKVEEDDIRNQLEAARAFVQFTLEFLAHVDEALAVAQTLLLSKSKTDILDAIDLLEYADAYNVETSKPGIRAVLHLVWAKADNDEENQVLKAVVKTYRDLFMTAPPQLETRRAAQTVADNLIALAARASEGELTSLERLLAICVDEDYIDAPVVARLWGLYQTETDISADKRRGAAAVLSMLAAADHSIARSGLTAIVKIGLGAPGSADLGLAAYSCVLLQHVAADAQKLPPTYELFDSLCDFLVAPAQPRQSMAWANMAKQALAAIGSLCARSPEVYTRILQAYVTNVFKEPAPEHQRQQLFGQMLFLSGEIALNLLVYLEQCDATYKKRAQAERENEADEEVLTGTREDVFEDALRDLREDMILYSDGALLKTLGEVVERVCRDELARAARARAEAGAEDDAGGAEPAEAGELGTASTTTVANTPFPHRQSPLQQSPLQQSPLQQSPLQQSSHRQSPTAHLQMIGATQSLAKFMCVSSKYCSAHLPLLMDLLAHHPSSVVRANLVVALSDIAVSFNQLVDEHTDILYDRLRDPDPEVQRTCIVALTFLILAGQIKVKGYLGEMAKALAHPNREIAKLTTMFFRELATKENAIYNSFLDMLSTLVVDDALPDAEMLRIVKFLAKFVDRDRHIKRLTDKLVQRLPKCTTPRQFNCYVQALRNFPGKMDEHTREIIALGYQRNPGDELGDVPDDEMDVDED